MAFPGELNLTYYKGDTQEFRIYPKQNNGQAFNMAGYTVKFSIAQQRGSSSVIECYAVIDSANPNVVNCTIRPADGAQLTPGIQYFYDVEIKKTSTPYDLVYTILNGTVSVTEQVSQA